MNEFLLWIDNGSSYGKLGLLLKMEDISKTGKSLLVSTLTPSILPSKALKF